MKLELPATRVTYKLPEILSQDEVQRIIKEAGNIKHKSLLMLIYSAGLRVSEAVRLRIRDIDHSRMTLHIRDCKNRKDRYVILSPVVYDILRKYWRSCRFKDYVFPGQQTEKHITTSAAGAIYQRAKERAGIKKSGGIHGLRHAFATHMLEAGEDLFVIKRLLGHSSIHSTVRYLSFIPGKDTKVKSPIDRLAL
jgi:site-specific recombinase XerD